MELSRFELVPGVITNVDDPEKLGRIKCSAIGLFDPNTMDDDILPWIMPIQMNKYQMFTKPEVGRKVWILDNRENENEFWYIIMFDYIDITERLVKERYDNELEVIISRKTPEDSAQIYYNNKDGFYIHYDEWRWHMKPEGEILAHGLDGDINIRNGHVYAGRDKEGPDYEPSVKCYQLQQVFMQASNDMEFLAQLASGTNDNPILKPGFKIAAKNWKRAAETAHGICARNVSIN